VKVVFENEQVILLYFCIRRVGVLYSNRSVRKRAITKGVIDADNILLRQPVPLAQWPPAILSLKKFVREAEFKLGISLQIADCADTKPLRFAASHYQRVCIVEAQRSCHAHAKFFERIPNLVQRQRGIAL